MMNSRVSYNASLSSRFFFAIVDALSLPTEGRKEGRFGGNKEGGKYIESFRETLDDGFRVVIDLAVHLVVSLWS